MEADIRTPRSQPRAITQPSKCPPSLSHLDGVLYLHLSEAPGICSLAHRSLCVLAPDILLPGRSQAYSYPIREETEAWGSLVAGYMLEGAALPTIILYFPFHPMFTVMWVSQGDFHRMLWPADICVKQAYAQANTVTQHFVALFVPGTLSFHYASQSCTAPWESRLGECGLCIPASINRHLVVKNWLLESSSQNLLFFVPTVFLLRQSLDSL